MGDKMKDTGQKYFRVINGLRYGDIKHSCIEERIQESEGVSSTMVA